MEPREAGLEIGVPMSTQDHNSSDSKRAGAQKKRSLRAQVERTRVRKRSYVMDLRIHSPESLGYLGIDGIDTAPALVRLAKVKGLDVIAVTDFYSGRFIDPIRNAAENTSLTVIPGVVIRCAIEGCNDVILLCLFPEAFDSNHVERFLRELRIPEGALGDESYTVELRFSEILSVIERFDGVALPSRMDKTPYRKAAIRKLVEDYGFRAFDLAYPESKAFFKEEWPDFDFQLFSFSSANALAQVGSRSARIKMGTPGFAGLREIISRDESLPA